MRTIILTLLLTMYHIDLFVSLHEFCTANIPDCNSRLGLSPIFTTTIVLITAPPRGIFCNDIHLAWILKRFLLNYIKLWTLLHVFLAFIVENSWQSSYCLIVLLIKIVSKLIDCWNRPDRSGLAASVLLLDFFDVAAEYSQAPVVKGLCCSDFTFHPVEISSLEAWN